MKISRYKLIFISILVLVIFMVSGSYAATVELTTGKLPDKLKEGEQVDFTIKIKNYEGGKQLVLDTNLVPTAADKPLWNFGESESVIDTNRYQQKITLNLSSLPAFLNVRVSGKVPNGIDQIKCDDVVLNKMHDTKLKFYEVRTEEQLVGIESFELIIGAKENFENTLQQIRRTELDGIKQEVSKVFYIGVTTEAQNIATEMTKMTWPDSLTLFGVITIKSSLVLDIIVVLTAIIMFIVGYVFGSRDPNANLNEED